MEKNIEEANNNNPGGQIQFTTGTVHIDIDADERKPLSGFNKEELEKYANDPFWIRLRMFIYVAFWLILIGMLAGAVAIIVWTPKCPAPLPRKWWVESPIVKMNLLENPATDFKDLEVFLKDLQQENVQSLCLNSVLKQSNSGVTTDFKNTNQQFGQIEDFKKFVSSAAEKGINIVIDIDPNHSSDEHPWFKKSVQKIGNYSSYYVWADGKPNPKGGFLPPNNWLNLDGSSAWTYNANRSQFYLHQMDTSQPDLNYNNTQVIEEFTETLKFWMNLGVKGFRLANTHYLYEDVKLKNETPGLSFPAKDNLYDSYTHYNTRHHAQNAVLLNLWRNVVLEHTNQEGLFTLIDELRRDTIPPNEFVPDEMKLFDLPLSVKSLSDVNANVTAAALNQTVSDMLSLSIWPAVDFTENNTIEVRSPENTALVYMSMLLPGTPILNINDSYPYKESFAKLTKARHNIQFQHGKTSTYILNNGTIFAYTRVKPGNPGYVVIYNSDVSNKTVDLSSLNQIAANVEVLALSPNHNQNITLSQKLSSNAIAMSPKSTFVGEYVVQKLP
ncbi:uncharacterized protein LOC106651823 isoform X1 [Trichogramma pretiosum]|uniref:uncharacterized protein LOC106651823 isoform X1 n=1 Tax=Trichogramma pretiosum TaxID=7493 RepID=UPI000C7199A4|nr:uncharacterized protein LOC106651823 isoform X1 [Trichogramma pretiosum]